MNGKKRYLVLALLLLLGFGAMTFAGGNDELEPVDGNNSNQVDGNGNATPERVDDAFNSDIVEDQNLLNDNNDNNNNVVTNPNAGNQNGNTANGNNNPVTPTVNPETLIAEVEKMLSEATKKEDVDGAEKHFNDNDVRDLTEALENGDNKDNLLERVEKLEKVFGDNDSPKISGINPNEVTNKPVAITIEDATEIEKVVTLNGEEIEFVDPFTEDGVYTITVTDEAHNETSVTFTIDTVAPKANIESGKHYKEFTLNVEDDNNFTIMVTKNHNETYEVENGTQFTEDATYKFVITDEAGNSVTIWTAIDNENPNIVVTDTEVEGVACKNVTVTDRYLMNLFINETKYTRNDFTSGVNNEYFKYENTICEEGEYVVLAEDKIGNPYSETFTIDRSEPVVSYSTIRFNNKKGYNTQDYSKYTTTYYVTNDDTFTYAIAFEEKLAYAPKLTIGGKEVTLKLVEKETYRDEKRIYVYEGVMEVLKSDNFAQGELKVELSDIVDEFGNELTDESVLKPNETTNHRVVVYDSIAAKLSYVAILSKKDAYDKAIKGDTIRFLVRFNEEMNTDNFNLKFDGKVLKFVKSQDVGYEYIIDYTIPQDTKMETGYLTFEVFGYTDKAGNGGDPITVANHSKYNKVYFDAIAPTITLKAEAGRSQNEHRVAVGSRVHYHIAYIPATVTDNSLDKPVNILPSATVTKCYPASANKACHTVEFKEWDLFDTDMPGVRYHLDYSYTDDSGYTTTRTMLLVVDDYKNPEAVDMGNYREINITKNINNGYLPFYNNPYNDKPLVINGNGHTVTQNIEYDSFYFDDILGDGITNRPSIGNMFASTDYEQITVQDLTFKGTTQSIVFGFWDELNQSNNSRSNTVVKNVNVKDIRVVSFSAGVSPAVMAYGKYTFDNVNITGTKLSEKFDPNGWAAWDLVTGNASDGLVENSNIDRVRVWDHAKFTVNNSNIGLLYAGNNNKKDTVITIGKGTVVEELIVYGKNVKLVVEEGATINKLNYNNKTLSTDSNIFEGTVLSEVNKK